MTVEIERVTPGLLGERMFQLPSGQLPSSQDDLKRSLVAECCRLCLAAMSPDTGGRQIAHILAIRGWVIRKLRSVITEFLQGDTSLFLDVLRESKGPTIEFLGDLFSLSGGYYCAAPSRVIEVSNRNWILVSGTPTHRFAEKGIPIKVYDVGRHIEGVGIEELQEFDIPVQSRESYAGITRLVLFNEESFENLGRDFEEHDWRPGPDWEIYLGNDGGWGFSWGPRGQPVSSSAGMVSLWREPSDLGVYNYWLRLMSRSGSKMYRIFGRLCKQVCLTIDRLAGRPRTVTAEEAENGVVVSMGFSPPEAQTRWLHAVGAKWLGSKGSQIRWLVPNGNWKPTVAILEELPLRVVTGGNGA